MSFLDKMKAANGMNWGEVESPDFPCCMLMYKNNRFYIMPGDMGGKIEYLIEPSNIKVFKLIGCGGEWAKYRFVFKDGKSAIVTQEVYTQRQRRAYGMNIRMAPLERMFKETEDAVTVTSDPQIINQQTPSRYQSKSARPNPAIEESEPEEEVETNQEIEEELVEPAKPKGIFLNSEVVALIDLDNGIKQGAEGVVDNILKSTSGTTYVVIFGDKTVNVKAGDIKAK